GLRSRQLLACEFGDEGSQVDYTEPEAELRPYLLALCCK
ncbi:hypothetical protein LCGC14_2765320, partial [marine sediment metagenome]